MVKRQLELFLKSEHRNQWLDTDVIRVYVRKSHRLYQDRDPMTLLPADDGGIIPFKSPNCLDIATVEVATKVRGSGVFKDFILHAEQVNPYHYIMVESVGNEDLRGMLVKHGYIIDPESYGLNFFKRNSNA